MHVVSNVFENPTMNKEVEGLLESIKIDLNAPFAPNFFKVWADAPEALRGIFPAMKHILASGNLDRPLKEMIILAISSKRDCSYCTAAHQAFCMMMGVTMESIQAIKSTYTITESEHPKYKAAIDYAVKLSDDSTSGTHEDVQQLKSHGYSKSDILEIIAMSGMSVFYNHLADCTQVNTDKAFLG